MSLSAIFLGEGGDDDERLHAGKKGWAWYKLAHVCQRWRILILASASYLDIASALVCTPGPPVADMLAHSPPIPLIIDHVCDDFDVDAALEVFRMVSRSYSFPPSESGAPGLRL